MTPDQELLRQYAEEGSDAAFGELVRRQVNFVHSVAVRVVAPDTHLAEDVTQRVFTDLARKARPLSRHACLAGWLHRTTRYTAISAIRSEQRRRAREHEAATMQTLNTTPELNWEQMRPLLDAAVDQLGPLDREAVLLRFFHGQSHREIGAALGLSENSANKRIERALEKLRGYFARRGVTTTSAILATAISANSVQAAPAGLAEKVGRAALVGSGVLMVGAGGAFLTAILFMSTKTKIILAVAIMVALVATVAISWNNWLKPAVGTGFEDRWAPAPELPKTSTIAAPALPPAPSVAVATGTTSAATSSATVNDPQAELSTALPDLITLIQNGDLFTAYMRYMPPSYFASMPQNVKDQLAQQEANLLADPNTAPRRQQLVQALQAMQTLVPTMNAAGDTATYDLPFPAGNPDVQKISFIKVDGKWYLSPGANALF
ncbi:MAG TPA: sigma-70 family RNA polymerase sigma factor [Opitutales bacterium]|nr:sigma-70 family RNA polymerase sigma factor [Opitutales bacterium]